MNQKKHNHRSKEQKRISDKKHYIKHKDKILAQYKVYRDSHKDQAKEYSKEYRKLHDQELKEKKHEYYLAHKDEIKSKVKKWRESNVEKDKTRRKLYRETHVLEIGKVIKLWRERNKDRRLVSNQNRRALKKKCSGRVTVKEWNDLLDKYGHKCLRCGSMDRLTQDHVIPLSMGGLHVISNIQPLCVSCNSSKHTDIVDYR